METLTIKINISYDSAQQTSSSYATNIIPSNPLHDEISSFLLWTYKSFPFLVNHSSQLSITFNNKKIKNGMNGETYKELSEISGATEEEKGENKDKINVYITPVAQTLYYPFHSVPKNEQGDGQIYWIEKQFSGFFYYRRDSKFEKVKNLDQISQENFTDLGKERYNFLKNL